MSTEHLTICIPNSVCVCVCVYQIIYFKAGNVFLVLKKLLRAKTEDYRKKEAFAPSGFWI